MVKAKVIVPLFNDLQDKKMRRYGEEYETTEERAKFLETVKAVEIIEVKPEVKTEEIKTEDVKEKKSTKKSKKIDKKKK